VATDGTAGTPAPRGSTALEAHVRIRIYHGEHTLRSRVFDAHPASQAHGASPGEEGVAQTLKSGSAAALFVLPLWNQNNKGAHILITTSEKKEKRTPNSKTISPRAYFYSSTTHAGKQKKVVQVLQVQ
jgi:hypothetical protein